MKGKFYDLYTKLIKNSIMFEKLFTESIFLENQKQESTGPKSVKKKGSKFVIDY